MHTFQPMTADMMEFDPFTKIGKEPGCYGPVRYDLLL